MDEPLAVDDGTALSYFHADGLGSIVKMTDGSGAVTLTRQYDAWGNLEVGASEPGLPSPDASGIPRAASTTTEPDTTILRSGDSPQRIRFVSLQVSTSIPMC